MAGTGSRRGRTALIGTGPRSAPPAVRALLLAATGPVLWFAHLNISYLLVPPSCRWGHRWAFGGVTVLALAGIAVASLASWRAWRGEHREVTDLVRFLGLAGALLGALFALTTLLVGASVVVVHPCH